MIADGQRGRTVVACEAAYSEVETSVGLVRPILPSLAGRESKLCSRLLGGGWWRGCLLALTKSTSLSLLLLA